MPLEFAVAEHLRLYNYSKECEKMQNLKTRYVSYRLVLIVSNDLLRYAVRSAGRR